MKTFDLILRLLYCAIAPIVLAAFAMQVPVAGIALGAVVATVLAVTEGQRWRDAAGRIPLIGRVFRGPGKLGAFYQDHPPKPLIYYVLFPVLLPYILFRKPLRAEWRLYRRSGAIAIVVLAITAIVEYVRKWLPELGIGVFLSNFAAVLIIQLLLTMVVIMPLVTTILIAHARRSRAWMWLLGVVLVVGTGVAVAFLIFKPVQSSMVDNRVALRLHAAPQRGTKALYLAASKAIAVLPPDTPEGLVHGAPLAAARHELRALWKADEVLEFGVWTTPSPRMVIVLELSKHHRTIAYGVDANGAPIKAADIPAAAAELLKKTKLPR